MEIMEDTIAAIATAVSEAGISIVRISGKQAIETATRIFRCGKKDFVLEEQPSHTIHYGFIYDGEERVDEVLLLLMKGPHSYTGEDTVEIDCHGGVYVTRQILETVIRHGARLAEPGEFTKLAFLNGRMDLAQAEAVIDVIKAKSEMPLQIAERQLKGRLGTEISEIRESLRDVLAQMAVNIDFPDEDIEQVESQRFCEDLSEVKEKVQNLLDTCDNGRALCF